MLINPATLGSAFIGYDTLYQSVFTQTKTYWDQIASLTKSTGSEERHAWLSKLPELREWVGERVYENIATRIEALVNKKYERSFKVPREAFEDDKLGVYNPAVMALAEQAKKWPDKIVIQAMIDNGLCYDGQNYFDTDHPIDLNDTSKGTQDNSLTGRALTAANYDYARQKMMEFEGEDEVSLEVVPNLLVVPPALAGTAKRIVEAEFLRNGDETVADTNIYKGTATVLVVPRLASSGVGADATWYLMDTSRIVKPLIFQERVGPEFQSFTNPSDPNVFHLDEYLFGVRARGVAGYGPW